MPRPSVLSISANIDRSTKRLMLILILIDYLSMGSNGIECFAVEVISRGEREREKNHFHSMIRFTIFF